MTAAAMPGNEHFIFSCCVPSELVTELIEQEEKYIKDLEYLVTVSMVLN